MQAGGPYEKGKTVDFPRVTLAVEHFGRVARLLDKKVPVEVEMNVETKFYDDDAMSYNTLAEIPGVDPKLKDQVVMLGGHLDSWHASEGATDNGAGVVVAMEVVRLLKKLGVQPRRTIRIALWSGEEQGIVRLEGLCERPFRLAAAIHRTAIPDSPDVAASTRRPVGVEAGARSWSPPTSISTTGPAGFSGSIYRKTRQCAPSSRNGWSLSATWE